MSWENAENALKDIEVVSNTENDPVLVKGLSDKLKCIGVGTDAAVFRLVETEQYAFKLFSEDKLEKMKMEERVYDRLGQSDFFPYCYGSGRNFLVLSYEQGTTLYDCLLKGTRIPPQAIEDVEHARRYAIDKGLKPRDIHLKNILLHNGRAKLLDVSEYMKEGNDLRWDYLKKGYKEYYHLIDSKAIPYWMINTVRKWYNQTQQRPFDFQEFVNKIIMLFKIRG